MVLDELEPQAKWHPVGGTWPGAKDLGSAPWSV